MLLETGRADLIGFNYAAHLAVKTENSLPNFEQYLNAATGSELVSLLNSVDVNQLMATASSSQVQQLVSKFAGDPAFARYLDAKTEVQLPAAGSAAYQALLQQTGRTDLAGFDYSAHVQAITQAQESVRKLGLGSQFGEAKIVYAHALSQPAANTPATTVPASATAPEAKVQPIVILGSDDNDVIAGTAGQDVLIAGKGNDQLSGGAGVDHVVIDDAATTARLQRTSAEAWKVQVANEVKTLDEVERVHFSNAHLALDLGMHESAGQTVLLIGAVFGAQQVSKQDYVGIGLDYLDSGTSYDDLANLALKAAGLSTPEKLVGTLWQNVVGRPATQTDMAPYLDMLAKGMPPVDLVALAAETTLNQSNVNLTGLADTGISYLPAN